ncbi:MAG: hypothetical protein WCO68_03230 [Verrucomicrobiota bacterium]
MSFLPPELFSVVDPRPIVRQVALEAFGTASGRPVYDGGRLIGTLHENEEATVCFFEEIVPADLSATREEQTLSVFETIARVLCAEGMEFRHLVRTWFYLDKILAWYDGFNQTRTPFLQARGAFGGVVPASTGIGMPNRFGAAVVAGALAIKPKKIARVREVASPLQCPALDYKSSFSRAVEVERADGRALYISGTASIEAGGKTAYAGEPQSQIELTMQVVAALLQSRQMDWSDTTRAIAYFKEGKDAPLFADYLRANGLEALPVTWMHGDICRDDLLFEIELDAVKKPR